MADGVQEEITIKVGQYVKIFQPTIVSPITDDSQYIRKCADFLMAGAI